MKRYFCIVLAVLVMLSVCACGSAGTPTSNQEKTDASHQGPVSSGSTDKTPADSTDSGNLPDADSNGTNNEDDVDNDVWDELASLGKVETENGLFYVSITLPADFVGEGVTQESIDANAGENYTSGKLNDDGSVTYKMTKKQHKAMLTSIADKIDTQLQEMVENPNYSFTKITHNSDFTSFDAYLSTEELGFVESLMVLGFYTYGGMYSVFTGKDVENISVNYYSSSGELINTANSSEMNN